MFRQGVIGSTRIKYIEPLGLRFDEFSIRTTTYFRSKNYWSPNEEIETKLFFGLVYPLRLC